MAQRAGSRRIIESPLDRPNTPIFAPMMVNVLCELINRQRPNRVLKIEEIVGEWGGGIDNLRRSCVEWDCLVSACCKLLPMEHDFWRMCLKVYNEPYYSVKMSAVQVGLCLLGEWQNEGESAGTYGPYPSKYEQDRFRETAIVPTKSLMRAIDQHQFEACFNMKNRGCLVCFKKKGMLCRDILALESYAYMNRREVCGMQTLWVIPWQSDDYATRASLWK